MKNQILKRFSLLGLLSAIIFSCAKKPNYSKVPQISFKEFRVLSQDSAFLIINFSDEDGDIGGGPNGEGNFFITYYFWDKDSSKYDLFRDTTFFQDTLDVRTFPSPSDAYKNKPISGEIALLMSPFRPDNDIKKFKYSCFIKDNGGNKSNIIQTPELNAP
ncbi:MAG: hypothetical protein KatS3mg027_0075 [Bacteroidia bacterium]|nr:MAG: hypothetical protein KatS3mg027_0075 [Bacteroidia bacterium]